MTLAAPPDKRVDGTLRAIQRKPVRCRDCDSFLMIPSATATPDDRCHGRRPWKSYKLRTVHDPERGLVTVDDPDGKLCGICFNVFRIRGALGRLRLANWIWGVRVGGFCVRSCCIQAREWVARFSISIEPSVSQHALTHVPGGDNNFSSIAKYHDWNMAEAGRHQVFLRGVDKFIAMHNADPGGTRIRNVEELRRVNQLFAEAKSASRFRNCHVDAL